MGNGVIAFIVALSGSVWIYGKLMRSTGNNTQSALTATVILAVCIFAVAFLLLKLIPA